MKIPPDAFADLNRLLDDYTHAVESEEVASREYVKSSCIRSQLREEVVERMRQLGLSGKQMFHGNAGYFLSLDGVNLSVIEVATV